MSSGAIGKMLIAYPLLAPNSYDPPVGVTRAHDGQPHNTLLRSRIVPIQTGSARVPNSPCVAYCPLLVVM
jgi:hypothetical protein